MRFPVILCAAVIAAITLFSAGLHADLDGSHVLPLDHEVIQYTKAPVDDAVTKLEKRIAGGKAGLDYDPAFGHLRSLLKQLNILESSQVLVFTKTSFQAPRISPRTPRAIYFNDDVAVGFVKTGEVLEIAAADPRQGIIFYTLDQEQKKTPRFDRQDQCLQCHAAGSTLGVPGLVVRSVYPDHSGMPVFRAGSFITDHRSPLNERWGGWYVTGIHGEQVHMGNAVVADKDRPELFDKSKGTNIEDLKPFFDTGAYPTPHSDIVALMMLEHQTRMRNLITRLGWETRLAVAQQEVMNKALGEAPGTPSESATRRINNAVEELVRYMLFTNEAPLTAEIRGTSKYATEYAELGPKDDKRRSLRQFDLKTRMMKYPCSPLIYSAAFDALPEFAKARVYERLWQVLSGADHSKPFDGLSAADRAAVRGILLATKSGLPEYWRQDSR
jgi:hypothetical protein